MPLRCHRDIGRRWSTLCQVGTRTQGLVVRVARTGYLEVGSARTAAESVRVVVGRRRIAVVSTHIVVENEHRKRSPAAWRNFRKNRDVYRRQNEFGGPDKRQEQLA